MGDLIRLLPSWANLLVIPGLIAGFTIHELAHACVAYGLGDVSQMSRGRISLNPLRHVFWLGMLTFILFGFGWARPVTMDVHSFKQRYVGLLLVSVSGALANLALAGLCIAVTIVMVFVVAAFSGKGMFEVLRLMMVEPAAEPGITAWAAAFTTYAVTVNLALAFFNLLPLPGLDGFNVLLSLFGLARGRADRPGAAVVPCFRKGGEAELGVSKRALASGSRQPAEIHCERGAEYHAAGNYEDAIARYRQAIASDQHHGPAYVNLGLAYLAAGQRERAIQSFRGATHYAPDEQSRREAWSQLNKLSEFNPAVTSSAAGAATDRSGPGPWRDTRSSFRWSACGVNAAILLVGTMCVYTCLTIALIGHFS